MNMMTTLLMGIASFAPISDPVPAVITEDLQIILPADQPLSEFYTIDISALKFTEASEANQFFGMFTENAVLYRVNFDERTVMVNVHTSIFPDWDLNRWNEYFATRSAKMKAVYESM